MLALKGRSDWPGRITLANRIVSTVTKETINFLVEAMVDENEYEFRNWGTDIKEQFGKKYSSLVGQTFPIKRGTNKYGARISDGGFYAALKHSKDNE